MGDIFPFLFFGCWNQPGPKPEPGQSEVLVPRDTVFEHIRSTQGDAKLIVLGGDNVYPRPFPPKKDEGKEGEGKEKKKKNPHEISVFDHGLGMYKSLGLPIFTAFGNHNVVEPEMKTYQMSKSGFNVEKTYYVITFGNIHFIVLDSNIIGDGTVNKEYELMQAWFETTVRELPADHVYFLVQHDPYFTARAKGYNELKHAEPFLEVLFSRPPIMILCADTHHYQHAIISKVVDSSNEIHQFIVGTAGANHDLHMPGFENHIFDDTYNFIKVEEVSGFGYLRIEGPHYGAAKFIKVDEWPHVAKKGGSRRRRLRRRRNHTKRRRSSK